MIKATLHYKEFIFRRPAKTSRGTLYKKPVYFIRLYEDAQPEISGIGECSMFPGLSMDDTDGYQKKVKEIVDLINKGWLNLRTPLHAYPSINFGIETALKDLGQKGSKVLYPSLFTEGKDYITINGLVWMGDLSEIIEQINEKLKQGFSCLKFKIGVDFNTEYDVLRKLRKRYASESLQIRLDANGAFNPENALEYLYRLSDLNIHSIEQPILPAQIDEMAALCETSPIPVALDEELIGKYPLENKMQLLKMINPRYIVLKPGILGGIASCEEWIKCADSMNIGWWVTSSLETNIGLNAIAQWTYTLQSQMAQGLSTGNLFVNNIDSPIALIGEKLYYFPRNNWNLSAILSK